MGFIVVNRSSLRPQGGIKVPWARFRTVVLPVLAAGAALVPLYGDPRATPVTHPEWARMVLRGLEMGEMLKASAQASQVFSFLSWKNTLTVEAERYTRGDGVELVGQAPHRRVVAKAAVAEVSYPIAIVRGGEYRLRLDITGTEVASSEVKRVGENTPAGAFSVRPGATPGFVDAGSVRLQPGVYSAAVLLPSGTSLGSLELAPPCLNPVEPLGGWRSSAIASTGDVAVTAIQAVDLESELPPAETAVEVTGADFRVTGGAGATTPASAEASLESTWLRAGPGGLQAVVFVDLSQAGLYSLSVFGIEGGGQSWLADSCRTSVLCPRGDEAEGPRWRVVLSGAFQSGRHFFSVTLGPGAVVARLRMERKKDEAADYLGTIRRLGFDPGPDGQPVTRSRAVDAMNWLRERRRMTPVETCDVPIPTQETTLRADVGPPPTGPTGPLPGFPGVPVPPTGPPVIPPQEPASPVVP
jgi:hypothetical protein